MFVFRLEGEKFSHFLPRGSSFALLKFQYRSMNFFWLTLKYFGLTIIFFRQFCKFSAHPRIFFVSWSPVVKTCAQNSILILITVFILNTNEIIIVINVVGSAPRGKFFSKFWRKWFRRGGRGLIKKFVSSIFGRFIFLEGVANHKLCKIC